MYRCYHQAVHEPLLLVAAAAASAKLSQLLGKTDLRGGL
jgi:hypothetical protein